MAPDLLIGSSKGYRISKDIGIPLIRVGFPIHDRLGGPRLLNVGYRGSQALLDQIVNALIEVKQESSDIGYTYFREDPEDDWNYRPLMRLGARS